MNSKQDPQNPGTGLPQAGNRAGTGIWQKLRTLFGSNPATSLRDSLKGVIAEHENGATGLEIGPEERLMFLNLLRFPDVRVDDIMVPRAEIVAIEDTATVRQLLDAFCEANHSRIPVFRKTLDDPTGMVHIKDFLNWLTAARPQTKKKNGSRKAQGNPNNRRLLCQADSSVAVGETGILRQMLFVPPSMRAADLLVKMQSSHIHMAVVVDEYGGTDGLVTIEDVVEEIVGEIADEHDDEDEVIKSDGKGNYIADARAPIEEVEELLNIDLLPDEREEAADTLGGFVFSMLGRVPVRGELVRHESGVEFEVLQADPRRITKLKIHTPRSRS